jgi:hypothetical protein
MYTLGQMWQLTPVILAPGIRITIVPGKTPSQPMAGHSGRCLTTQLLGDTNSRIILQTGLGIR